MRERERERERGRRNTYICLVWSNVGRKIGKKWVQRKYIKKVIFGRDIGQLTLHGGKNERERVEGKRDIRRQREREREREKGRVGAKI